ncbi:nucleotidyltransferase domain-containing protein [Mediterraneibacter gnavus]|nr:nucleotidyltransferase domain-containing protein [Mediterraneibacter gnavus]
MVLYGSYARGNNTFESDGDVALLLNGNFCY